MDIYSIENERLSAKFRTQGGELIELFDKITQTHRLKQGTLFWSYYAPILFPIVGRSFNDTIRFQGKSFLIGKHGFLRKSLMKLHEHNAQHIAFQLESNSETLKIYPFVFQIFIEYTLEGRTLKNSYTLINKDEKNLSFQIGAHPAFHLHAFKNLDLENHYLEFSHNEKNIRYLINSDGYFTGETEIIPLENQKLFLKDSFFEQDAIILKNIHSRNISLKNLKNEHGITVHLTSANVNNYHLGIWKPVKADFVCIEPWAGCADPRDFYGDFTEKETYLGVLIKR
jgi:galactose mutarotase-like enzyme